MKQHILLLGGIIIDQYILIHEFPQRGDDILVQDSFNRIGGCAINVASTIKNLGGSPHIVSTIGDDERGNSINQYIITNGYFNDTVRVAKKNNTGYCISLIEDSGERSFLTFKGCEAEFYTEMVSDELIKNISFVFVTGYYLLDSKYSTNVVNFVKKVKSLGVTVIFDPGSLVHSIEKSVLLSMLELTDIITPNVGEFKKLNQFCKHPESNVDWFFEKGIRYVIVKDGSAGVTLWKNKHDKIFYPSYKMKTVDTSGAGDSFVGGLMYGLLQNHNIENAIQIGSACGALATTFIGPHGDFSLKDIIKIIGE